MKKKLLLVMLGIALMLGTAQNTYAYDWTYKPGSCDDMSPSTILDGGGTLEDIQDLLNDGAWTNPEYIAEANRLLGQHSEQPVTTEEEPVQQKPMQDSNGNSTPATPSTDVTKNTIIETVDETETIAHEHNFTETVTKEPTCTALGEKTFTCECGETYTEPIAMIEHTPGEWEEETAATCTTEGKDVQKCTVCGNVIAERTTTLTHLAGEWEVTKPATMISKGTEVKKCVDCGKELETRETPVLMYPWYIIGGVVVLGGALTTVIAVKRKKD